MLCSVGVKAKAIRNNNVHIWHNLFVCTDIEDDSHARCMNHLNMSLGQNANIYFCTWKRCFITNSVSPSLPITPVICELAFLFLSPPRQLNPRCCPSWMSLTIVVSTRILQTEPLSASPLLNTGLILYALWGTVPHQIKPCPSKCLQCLDTNLGATHKYPMTVRVRVYCRLLFSLSVKCHQYQKGRSAYLLSLIYWMSTFEVIPLFNNAYSMVQWLSVQWFSPTDDWLVAPLIYLAHMIPCLAH